MKGTLKYLAQAFSSFFLFWRSVGKGGLLTGACQVIGRAKFFRSSSCQRGTWIIKEHPKKDLGNFGQNLTEWNFCLGLCAPVVSCPC